MANLFDDVISDSSSSSSGGSGGNLFDDVIPPTPTQPTFAQNVARSGAARFAAPTLGALGAGAALTAATGGADLPFLAIPAAAGLGSTVMEALRQRMAGQGFDPSKLVRTGVENAAFPAAFESVAPAVEAAAPLLSRIAPSLANEGSVLNTAVRSGMAGLAPAGIEGAANPPSGATSLLGRAQSAGREMASSVVPNMVTGGLFQAVPNFIRSARGVSVQRAKDALSKASDEIVLSVRRGGSLEATVKNLLKREADNAWQPATNLAASITDPVTMDDLSQASMQRFGNDPQRLAGVKNVFEGFSSTRKGFGTSRRASFTAEDIPKANRVGQETEVTIGGQRMPASSIFAKESFSAKQLVDLSSRIGQKIPKGVMAGRMPADAGDLASIDARTVIADVLEQKAPDHLKDAFQLAKQQWGDYVSELRNPLVKIFSPSASPKGFTSPGVDFLKRVADGTADPSEMRFIRNFEQQTGTNIVVPLQRLAENVRGELGRQQITRRLSYILGPTGLMLYLLRSAAFHEMRKSLK